MPLLSSLEKNCCGNNICESSEDEFSCPQECIPITLGTPISDTTTGLPPLKTRAPCEDTSKGTGGAKMYRLSRASGLVTLDLCNNETLFDSQIGVYTKRGDCVAGNDDSCGFFRSSVTFNARASETYDVWV